MVIVMVWITGCVSVLCYTFHCVMLHCLMNASVSFMLVFMTSVFLFTPYPDYAESWLEGGD